MATRYCLSLDALRQLEGSSRVEVFIGAWMKHVHVDLMIVGFLLLSLRRAMIGAPMARVLRRWIVLPLLQLGHHVLLVGAEAVLVTIAVLWAQGGAEPKSLAAVAMARVFLLIGGLEMQAAEYVCGLADEKITEHMPMPIVVGGSLVVAVFLAVLLIKQIGSTH